MSKRASAIKVLHFVVGQEPEVKFVPNEPACLRELVGGGWLESYSYPFPFGLTIFLDEEGRLKDLPQNRLVGDQDIRGDFFLTRFDAEGESIDLTDEDIERYREAFPPFLNGRVLPKCESCGKFHTMPPSAAPSEYEFNKRIDLIRSVQYEVLRETFEFIQMAVRPLDITRIAAVAEFAVSLIDLMKVEPEAEAYSGLVNSALNFINKDVAENGPAALALTIEDRIARDSVRFTIKMREQGVSEVELYSIMHQMRVDKAIRAVIGE